MTRRRTDILVLVLILAAMAIAWFMGHTQDDAFITFRYSQNLVAGNGPVYNPGEHVEGYSNFLWMLVMAVPIAMGLDPVTPSWLLGLLFMGLNLWLCYRLFSRVLKCHKRGFLVFLLLVSGDALLGFGTSGLETSMNAFLWTWLLWLAVGVLSRVPEQTGRWRWALLGFVGAFCLLSRPDGAVIVFLSGAFVLFHLMKHKQLRSVSFLISALALFLPVGIWLIWKWDFYGDLLPNTFYAKTGVNGLRDGVLYVGLFVLSYGLVIPAAFIPFHGRKLFDGTPKYVYLLWALVMIWAMYLVWIGGDFMFFRMWVPVLPAIYLALGVYLFRVVETNVLRYGLFACLLLANLLHFEGYGRWYPAGFAMPLERWTATSTNWLSYANQGKALKEILGPAVPPVRVAVGAAGASPYYSGLPAVDIFGLTNREIARHGRRKNMNPGHVTWASYAQLREAGVNLWLHTCVLKDRLPKLENIYQVDIVLLSKEPTEPKQKRKVQVVKIPVAERFVLLCPYIVPHPYIDAKIQSGDFQMDEVIF